jgi:hypothetical protein
MPSSHSCYFQKLVRCLTWFVVARHCCCILHTWSLIVCSMNLTIQVQQQQLAEWWAQRFPAVTSTNSNNISSSSGNLCSKVSTLCSATAVNTAAGCSSAEGSSSSSSNGNASSTTLAELESALQQKCGSCREHLAQQQAVQLAATDAVECSAMPSMLAQAAAAAGTSLEVRNH